MLVAWCYQKGWLDLRGNSAAVVGLASMAVGVGLVAYCLKVYAFGGSPSWVSAWHVVWFKTILCAGFASALIGFVVWQGAQPRAGAVAMDGHCFLRPHQLQRVPLPRARAVASLSPPRFFAFTPNCFRGRLCGGIVIACLDQLSPGRGTLAPVGVEAAGVAQSLAISTMAR